VTIIFEMLTFLERIFAILSACTWWHWHLHEHVLVAGDAIFFFKTSVEQ